jgi:hypothetical protein
MSPGHILASKWNGVCLIEATPINSILQIRRKSILLTSLFAAAWIVAVSIGLGALLNYESVPGGTGAVPSNWPAGSRIARATSGDTLVMLAHPHCPCTRASMSELAQVMAQVQGKVRAYVLFLKPKNSGGDWDDTDLRRSATDIPGVTVVSDLDGAEARRFGAETSGHTLLFDPAGNLLFSGGITQSRGHAGGNAGESAIVSLVNTRTADRAKTLVFGCSLFDRKGKEAKTLCLR